MTSKVRTQELRKLQNSTKNRNQKNRPSPLYATRTYLDLQSAIETHSVDASNADAKWVGLDRRVEMGGLMVERYQKLGLKESLSRAYHYPIACEELSCMLRNAYSKIPKNLQSLIFQDSLAAFRLLPQMQTQTAISAANGLLHSIEAALPKQKKVVAASEFKQAMVAQRRRRKVQPMVEGRGMWQLVTTICGSRYILTFTEGQVTTQILSGLPMVWRELILLQEIPPQLVLTGKILSSELIEVFPLAAIPLWLGGIMFRLWFIVFIRVAWFIDHRTILALSIVFIQRGNSRKVTSQRGFCKQCNSIVWLSNSKCSNECFGKISDEHQILPVSIRQIVDYVIEESIPSSDSDSDSDDSVDGSLFKLWAYPMRFGELHA